MTSLPKNLRQASLAKVNVPSARYRGDHLGLVLDHGPVARLVLLDLPLVLPLGRHVLDDHGAAVAAVLEDGRDQRDPAVDCPAIVLEGEVAPFGLARSVGPGEDQPPERRHLDLVDALPEERFARYAPEVEQAVVRLDDPPLVVDDHDLLPREAEEARERHPLGDGVDLGHPDLPDLHLPREEQDLEVLGRRVPVDPEPLRDLGDDQALRVRLEKRPDPPGDGPVLFKAHDGILHHGYINSK